MEKQEFDFRSWIRDRKQNMYDLVIEDDDHYCLQTAYGTARINFYPDQIVEISITSAKTDEIKYYLHFQLVDDEHTRQLFYEMEEALDKLRYDKNLKILLSCTSGFTTSYFAQELNEAARTLHLDYSFDAVPYVELYDKAENYDIVLLAPQIGYMKKKISLSMPEKLIVQIPTSTFAAYDAMGMIRFVEESLKEKKKKKKKKSCSGLCCKAKSTHTILCMALIYDGSEVSFYTRLYQDGIVLLDETTIRPVFDVSTIWDTINYAQTKATIDFIAIAMPGTVDPDGSVDFECILRDTGNLKKSVQERYRIPTLVVNNTNAGACGYHVLHPEYSSIVLHSQPYGKGMGGQGIIVNGKLVTGLGGISGEVKYYLKRMQFSDSPKQLGRTESGQIELVVNALLATISLLGPEIIALRTPMVSDMNMLEKRLAHFIPERSLPKLEFISDINELIFEGMLELAGIEHRTILEQTSGQPAYRA